MFREFKSVCIEHGFHSRGKACFRVIGDGVLQILKYDKSPVPYNPTLQIGLFSLYGEIDPLWLTSIGCITRYNVYSLVYPPDTTLNFLLSAPEMAEQLTILQEKGFAWLDGINNQPALSNAICEMDISRYAKIRWNDLEKLAPNLKAGKLSEAEKVIQALIDQHLLARQRMCGDISQAINKRDEADMRKFKTLLEMVHSQNETAINGYLNGNYSTNIKIVKFCM